MNWAANGRWLDRSLIALLLGLSMTTPARLWLRKAAPAPDSAVAVVFAPWTRAELATQRVAAAGARIVRLGGLPFIVVAAPSAATGDFAQRLSEQGAWFTLDPLALAGCFTSGGGR